MPVTIYHNPDCSKSRATLELLQARGEAVEVIEYLKTPPQPEVLDQVCHMLNLAPEKLIRTGENRFAELGLSLDDNRDRVAWLQMMHDNPILIERPIVVYQGIAELGRPPENVLNLFLPVIHARIKSDKPYLIEGRKWHEHFNHQIFKCSLFLLFPTVCFAVLDYMGKMDQPWIIAGPLIITLLTSIIEIVKHVSFKKRLKTLEETGQLGQLVEYTFSDRRFSVTCDARSGSGKWSGLEKTVLRPESFLLYLGSDAYHWFPESAFSSKDDFQNTLKILKTQTKFKRPDFDDDDDE